MTQLSPQTIRRLSPPMIMPFIERTVHEQTGMSGGLSCAGYDVHMGDKIQGLPAFKRQPTMAYDYHGNKVWMLPKRTGCLAVTKEKFTLPPAVSMQYFNKSTLARQFINACATLGEPGWEGYLTLELYNQTDDPVFLYPGQPIGQVVFHLLDEPSETPYAGKYQGQGSEPVAAKREES